MRVPSFLLKYKAQIKIYKGTGVYGPTFAGDPIFTKCYYEMSTKKLEFPDGQILQYYAEAVFPAGLHIPIGSQVEVEGRTFEVMQSERVRGWTNSCVEVIMR